MDITEVPQHQTPVLSGRRWGEGLGSASLLTVDMNLVFININFLQLSDLLLHCVRNLAFIMLTFQPMHSCFGIFFLDFLFFARISEVECNTLEVYAKRFFAWFFFFLLV